MLTWKIEGDWWEPNLQPHMLLLKPCSVYAEAVRAEISALTWNASTANCSQQQHNAAVTRLCLSVLKSLIKMTETWGTSDWVNETADTEIIYGPHKHWDIGMLMKQCFCCQWKIDDLKLLTNRRKPLHLSDVWDPKHNYKMFGLGDGASLIIYLIKLLSVLVIW